MGRDHHSRGAQRRGPWHALAAQPARAFAGTALGHAHHALGDPARRTGAQFREPDRTGVPLGWEDIRGLPDATITRTILDDTLPGGPHERTITYEAPFTRCNREADYRAAWTTFFQRLDHLKAT